MWKPDKCPRSASSRGAGLGPHCAHCTATPFSWAGLSSSLCSPEIVGSKIVGKMPAFCFSQDAVSTLLLKISSNMPDSIDHVWLDLLPKSSWAEGSELRLPNWGRGEWSGREGNRSCFQEHCSGGHWYSCFWWVFCIWKINCTHCFIASEWRIQFIFWPLNYCFCAYQRELDISLAKLLLIVLNYAPKL